MTSLLPLSTGEFRDILNSCECPVTFAPLTDPVTLVPCGHTLEKVVAVRMYGEMAVNACQKREVECPCCRTHVHAYYANPWAKDMVERIVRFSRFQHDPSPEGEMIRRVAFQFTSDRELLKRHEEIGKIIREARACFSETKRVVDEQKAGFTAKVAQFQAESAETRKRLEEQKASEDQPALDPRVVEKHRESIAAVHDAAVHSREELFKMGNEARQAMEERTRLDGESKARVLKQAAPVLGQLRTLREEGEKVQRSLRERLEEDSRKYSASIQELDEVIRRLHEQEEENRRLVRDLQQYSRETEGTVDQQSQKDGEAIAHQRQEQQEKIWEFQKRQKNGFFGWLFSLFTPAT